LGWRRSIEATKGAVDLELLLGEENDFRKITATLGFGD
jgi:hypothetical protein